MTEEIKVKDLFEHVGYPELNREDAWSKALDEGYVYHILTGRFTRKAES